MLKWSRGRLTLSRISRGNATKSKDIVVEWCRCAVGCCGSWEKDLWYMSQQWRKHRKHSRCWQGWTSSNNDNYWCWDDVKVMRSSRKKLWGRDIVEQKVEGRSKESAPQSIKLAGAKRPYHSRQSWNASTHACSHFTPKLMSACSLFNFVPSFGLVPSFYAASFVPVILVTLGTSFKTRPAITWFTWDISINFQIY